MDIGTLALVWLASAGVAWLIAVIREDPEPGKWAAFGLILGPIGAIGAFVRAGE